MRLHATIGDGPTVRRLQLVDATNTGVDLTGVTGIVWTAVGRTSGRTITGAATVVTAATGVVDITLTSAHLAAGSGAVAEVMDLHTVCTWADAVETFPTPGADELRLDPR